MLTEPDRDTVRRYIGERSAEFFADLGDWLRIPSVSGDPDHVVDVRRSAEWLAAKLRVTGFPAVEIWETAGNPAVFAEWPADEPDAPTALVYGHHDVQPADRGDGWSVPPFEPTVRGERLYARGAADDKGQVFFHTLGVRALLASTGRGSPPVHLKLLVEGEEEDGSAHFADLLRAHHERLACDVVVVSDTDMWGADTPSTCTAMRGLLACQVDFFGPATDVHSGSFGGAVPNPATEIAKLVAALHDDDRRITVPGFYDDVVPLDDRERRLIESLPFDEAAWLRDARSGAPLGEAGFTTLERVWARPTAEVNGLWSGYSGPGSKTIIPASAHVKLTFRLVADQDPDKVFEAFGAWVAARVPAGIRHAIEPAGAVRPCLTPLDHPALGAVTRALERAFETDIRYTRVGGSGPEADLQDVLEVPVVFLGVSIPDDGWHGPDEKVEMPLLLKGAESAAYLWHELAAVGAGLRTGAGARGRVRR